MNNNVIRLEQYRKDRTFGLEQQAEQILNWVVDNKLMYSAAIIAAAERLLYDSPWAAVEHMSTYHYRSMVAIAQRQPDY